MGNCLSLSSSVAHEANHPNTNTAGNSQLASGSSQFAANSSNSRLLCNGNSSTSLGRSSYSGGFSRRFFGPSSSNNTSTSLWGSDHSHNTRARDEEEFPNGQILDAANLREFTLPELKAATRNFKDVLGEGGFGTVYKGWLKERASRNRAEDLTVAIKKLNSDSMQGFVEWLSEVNFLGRLSHPNLIKLFGFGREDNELFLVYEYMHRGSLANQLYGRGANVRPLPWDARLKIMIRAARGLAFLHSLDIIYRDFKPSNILLDMTYTAKLSDFGLAKSGPSGDQSHVSTHVMGTFGYAAPEYIATGHLYLKSDVYGFGIVLVEMLTGKQIHEILRLSQQNTVRVWLRSNILNRVKMRSTMDARFEGKYPPNLAFQVAELAYKCIGADHKIRPSMKQVVETLEQIEAANEKPADSIKRVTNPRAVQRRRRQDDG